MRNKIFIATALALLIGWPAPAAQAASRLRTQFTGLEKCLDIINDGVNNTPIMAWCGNYSGQAWTITASGVRGYYKLRTEFTGPTKCLDIISGRASKSNKARTRFSRAGKTGVRLWLNSMTRASA